MCEGRQRSIAIDLSSRARDARARERGAAMSTIVARCGRRATRDAARRAATALETRGGWARAATATATPATATALDARARATDARAREGGLKARVAAALASANARLRAIKRAHGDEVVGEVTVNMVAGGMRGITAMLYETSLLDAEEGIRFRGRAIPELREKLPKARGGRGAAAGGDHVVDADGGDAERGAGEDAERGAGGARGGAEGGVRRARRAAEKRASDDAAERRADGDATGE